MLISSEYEAHSIPLLTIFRYVLWRLKHIQLILKRAGLCKFHCISSPVDYYTPLDRQIFKKE